MKPSPSPAEHTSDEAQRVLNFCLDRVVLEEGKQESMAVLLDAYQDWLEERGFPDASISVDGFGRMFPRIYQRRVIFRNGSPCRGIVNAGLRD